MSSIVQTSVKIDINESDWQSKQLLAEGAFGAVYKVLVSSRNQTVIVKIAKNNDLALQELKNEGLILR